MSISSIQLVVCEDARATFTWLSHTSTLTAKSATGVGAWHLPNSDDDDVAWVNLPFDATLKGPGELVTCEVMRSSRFRPDSPVFTAEVNLTAIPDDGQIQVGLRDSEGRNSDSMLKLQFHEKEYVAGTLGGANAEIKADFFWTFFVRSFHHIVDTIQSDISKVVKPSAPADPDLDNVTIPLNTGGITHPKDDENFPLSIIQRLVFRLIKYFPLTDKNNPVEDRAFMRNVIRTKKLLTNVLKPPEGRWNAPLSDASMSRVFFNSVGMFYVNKNGDDDPDKYFVADFSMLTHRVYQPKLENLGCHVFFDNNANITMIENYNGTVYRPGDDHWGWAKLKARSAAFVSAGIDHLLHYHLFWGNIPGMALRMFLSPDHDVRLAFTPHIFKTHRTCANAEYVLVQEKGGIGRALPFELKPYITKAQEKVKFTFYPDELDQRGIKGCPHHIGATDGMALREVLMNYTSNLFDEIYPTADFFNEDEEVKTMYTYLSTNMKGVPKEFSLENLKLIFGEVLFRVTGMHQVIGNVAVFALDPFMVNFRMAEDDVGVKGNWETMMSISVISGRTLPNSYPTMSDNWAHLLHWRKSRAYIKLRSDLVELGDEIDERNKNRFMNVDFHPEVTAISVLS